jgi:CRISPR-associated endonuclease/helicase Cas3
MKVIEPAEFSTFFQEVHGHGPFPWQQELAGRVCTGDWPAVLALPTGSGKTACLDIAVFALATQAHLPLEKRRAPRRIFFVVNRRVIVDEAFYRGCKLAHALCDPTAQQPMVARVRDALRRLTGEADAPPLDVFELRGGVYRDNRWTRSLLQPTILTSTLDQFGSRLLFRGYGVSPAARPIHAALTANDALVLLDEAHISRAFAATVNAVAQYRDAFLLRNPVTWRMPFVFVEMSATPPHAPELPRERVLKLSDTDRQHPVLRKRLHASKPVTRLRVAENAKGEHALQRLAEALVEEAGQLANNPGTIAIMVNRVATAQAVHAKLKEKYPETQLVIGRMRPVDRDELTRKLRDALATDLPNPAPAPRFVVATQCLEVGADLDFHSLITECASLDALRQRFGRVNRSGDRTVASSVIVIRADQAMAENKLNDEKPIDPIYGNVLTRTWLWLNELAATQELDFGLEKMDGHVATLRGSDPARLQKLFAAPVEAPILLPAYIDCWSQTNPAPAPDPDPALFLHGPRRGQLEVQICFRHDLPEDRAEWLDTISLLPPTSPELLSVPLAAVRALFSDRPVDETTDLLEAGEDLGVPAEDLRFDAVIWRGPRESREFTSPAQLAPGDTLVARSDDKRWATLGCTDDVAEKAFRQARAKEVLRLRKELFLNPPPAGAFSQLLAWASDAELDWDVAEIRATLLFSADELATTRWLRDGSADTEKALRRLAEKQHGLIVERYRDGSGVVLRTRRRVRELIVSDALPSFDEGEDDLSITDRAPISICDHTADVEHELEVLIQNLPLDQWIDALRAAAALHDWGKADERFQAMLLNGDRATVWAQEELWAKSDRLLRSRVARDLARRRAELPSGFRHEMISTQLAPLVGLLPDDEQQRILALHLIASHHGYGRPFAPFVDDPDPPELAIESRASRVILSSEERHRADAHALESGIAERFWTLNRSLGPRVLVWIETALRLADQLASENPVRRQSTAEPGRQHEVQLS